MPAHLGEKTNGCKIPKSDLQREKNVQGRLFNLDKLLVCKSKRLTCLFSKIFNVLHEVKL